MRLIPAAVALALFTTPLLAEDAPPAAPKAGAEAPATEKADANAPERVMRLTIAEIGRLVLRNSPQFQLDQVDPVVARTRTDEALAEFDTLFAARGGFARSRTPVFFSPTTPAGGEMEQNAIDAGASLRRKETWGGSWDLGYQANSSEERGAISIQSLQPRYSGAVSLGYTHPLLRGGGETVTLSRVEQAEQGVRASEHVLRRQAEAVVAQAEAVYWRLVGAIADRGVREKSLRVAEELLSVAQARLDSGRGIQVQVTEARAGVEARRVDLIAAQNDVANLGDDLRELVLPFTGKTLDLGLRIEPGDEPASAVGELPDPPGRSALTAAFERRGDVLAARADVAAAKIAQMRAEDDELAQLDAVAGGSLSGVGTGFRDSADQIGDRRLYDWRVGLELSVPLGNEAALARSRRARAESLRANRRLTLLENLTVRELRQATRNVRSAAERIEAAVRARQASQEQLAAERSRLENGVATPFELLQVEEDLSEAEAREIRARVDFEVARVSLELARGTLLTSRALDGLIEAE